MRRLLPTAAAALVFAATWAACSSTRAGYESAGYEVVAGGTGAFEIRRYPATAVAATASQESSGRDGSFMRLFRYIDGGNGAGQKIAMTTPVITGGGKMHFVIPRKVAAAGAPEPLSETVSLETIPGGLFAAARFPDREQAKSAAEALVNALKNAGKRPVGSPLFAYYDPPWTPKALRRNEVLIRIALPGP